MPPKRKPNASELRKALREKHTKMKASEAQLAAVQAANENKRGTSPAEQVQIAKKIKQARTNKSHKLTCLEDEDDCLKEKKELIAKAIGNPVFAVIKFSKGGSSHYKLAPHAHFCAVNQTME